LHLQLHYLLVLQRNAREIGRRGTPPGSAVNCWEPEIGDEASCSEASAPSPAEPETRRTDPPEGPDSTADRSESADTWNSSVATRPPEEAISVAVEPDGGGEAPAQTDSTRGEPK